MDVHSKIKALLIVTLAIIASLILGVSVVTSQTQTLLWVGGVTAFIICALLGQKVWLAFIFLFTMQVPIVRGFTSQEFGQFILIGFSMMLFLMRKLRIHLSFGELDFWRITVALIIAQVYFRNPVGLNIMGADSVGARPYFVAAVAFMTGCVLSQYRVDPKEIKWSVWISIAAAFVMFPLNSWRYGLGRDTAIETVGVVAGMEGEGAGRIGKYERMAQSLSAILVSRISPLKACVHPLWGLFLLLVLGMAAMSGYRNSVAYVGIVLLIGIAYRGGFISLVISCIMGVFALGSIALLNLAYPLPGKVQRALSPFPGTWEEKYIESADDSTEWRIDMWKAALLTDDWIKNKILGDGLGMTREEMMKMQDMETRRQGRGYSGLNSQQESMMITGAYHSGPVQSIRTVGYVGLAIMLAAMIRMMVLMHREIIRSKGTDWYVTMLFIGIPIMTYPIFFTLIFGTFKEAAAFIFVQSGMIDLIRKNLPLPHFVKPSRTPYLLPTHLNRNSPMPRAPR
jgi:hypothetical protein